MNPARSTAEKALDLFRPNGNVQYACKGSPDPAREPVRDSRLKKERDAKIAVRKRDQERKKLDVIGKKEARERGVWKFDEKQARFDLFVPLHALWMDYMSELLGLPPKPATEPSSEAAAKAMPHTSGMHPKLLKADFHGSIMTVSQSKNPCIVGLSGIVIHETENAFKVITRENKVKLLPKLNQVFKFALPLYATLPSSHNVNTPFVVETLSAPTVVAPSAANTSEAAPLPLPTRTVLDQPHIEFELYGNQFRFRSADRAGRKFKHKETIEL
ncbi:hypothetical protein HYPSUDRAFT_55982 [Hypholoma sublateritium FD-334 SS-4]|uniref:Ribonuclease P protein subunit n=1 Tax=Hypholoma sublateritium (strain FD-334 SS-4) TaxID=945553 RepID=A0A0D2MAW0_HYPSF|nr:hypothetical protein HYPSUDRAFT_55982 [Hypholoma sublateritium FD-334 SS-4]